MRARRVSPSAASCVARAWASASSALTLSRLACARVFRVRIVASVFSLTCCELATCRLPHELYISVFPMQQAACAAH